MSNPASTKRGVAGSVATNPPSTILFHRERTGTVTGMNHTQLRAESLLEELFTGRGLGRSDIARFCGVPAATVRGWEAGEPVSSDHRFSLARLATFLDSLQHVASVKDPSGWMNVRLMHQSTVTAGDLYLAGRALDLLVYAQGDMTTEQLLDECAADWRTETRPEWQIAATPDGERVLTRRE